jgi:fibronectin-binding autotransporter adhesin
VISGYGALTSGAGIINNSQIVQSGGILTISAGSVAAVNAGTITLTPGYALRLSSGTLSNQGGTIELNSSTLAGSGLLNVVSGSIVGPGTITAFLQISGGILSVPPGTTNITQPFANTGSIQLSGFTADLAGGSIANSGSIQGNGQVANAVNNTGMIESIDGTLTISGSLQNGAGGLLAVDDGSKLLVSSGLAANLGTINLTGGVFDNNSLALSNSAEISGYGTVRTGGLANFGIITLTGATSTLNGPVTNASAGTINVSYNPAIFTGNVINNGYVKSTSTTVTWAGGFTNNGTYHSDPAQNYFSSLANGPTGLVLGGAGDGFFVTGPLATNAGDIDLGATSTMVVDNGAGVFLQSAGTLEMGTGATLSAGSVEISGGKLLADGPVATITANLIYDSPAASTYQGILAGAGNSLTVNGAGALLVLSGSNTYGGDTNVQSGTLVVDSPAALPSGTSLIVGIDANSVFAPVLPGGQGAASAPAVSPVPEPGTLALLAAGTLMLIGRQRRH